MVNFYGIPLLNGLGFFYCKTISTKLIITVKKEKAFNTSFVYVFDYHSKKLENISVDFFDTLSYISTPYIVTKVAFEKGKNRWKKVDSRKLNESEFSIPKFKYNDKRFYNRCFDIYDDRFKVINNFNSRDKSYQTYDEVKDLGLWVYYSECFIQKKLSIMQANFQKMDKSILFEDLKDDLGFKLALRQVELGL